MNNVARLIGLLLLSLGSVSGFVPQLNGPSLLAIIGSSNHHHRHHRCPHGNALYSTPKESGKDSDVDNSSESSESLSAETYTSIFNFANKEEDAVSKFERIDDAIMGGISLSSIRQQQGDDFARWSGICRTDGGGFCGTRTLPFLESLDVGDADGLYLLCRLASDDEPDRRVWKITTRTKRSRGERLYQAAFQVPKPVDDQWSIVKIPFSDFCEVSGPRIVEGAKPLNTTGGLYQVGVILSKFQIGKTSTFLEDFRPGYFELQIKEIGAFKTNGPMDHAIAAPLTMTKQEMEKNRTLATKVLFKVMNVFFSERKRRRDAAMRMMKQRGMSRLQAIQFGIKRKSSNANLTRAIFSSLKIIIQDTLRLALFWTLRLILVYPIIVITKIVKFVTRPFKKEKPVLENVPLANGMMDE